MKTVPNRSRESGMALVTTLLVLMLISAMMVGFYAAVNSDVRATSIDRDQTQAYAVAHAGLEKLTSDLASLFQADVSPSNSQILGLAANVPTIPGFEFRAPGGAANSGYSVVFNKTDVNGNPAPEDVTGSNITSGAYKGLKGIITKYPITITARSTTGRAEVRLRRELQTVAVPVFQFGIFSETDLTFYAGDNFDFGGRVHTNGNLFLSELYGKTLKFTDRLTAVKEVARAHFSNGLSVDDYSFTGNVEIPTAIGSPGRNLKYTGPNEASVTNMPGAGQTLNTNWTSLSVGTYKSIIRSGLTGAKKLDLPLVSQGAVPIDLIRRPGINENNLNPPVFGQRFFSQASLRILLSDVAADITGLPTITAAAPIALDSWTAVPGWYNGGAGVNATHPPIARSEGPLLLSTALNGNPTVSSGIFTMPVDLIPAAFKIPLLTVDGLGGVICTGKTANTFTGCNTSLYSGTSIPANRPVTATVTPGSYTRPVSTTTVGSTTKGLSVTITVPANGTLDFSRRWFWVNGVSTTAPAVAASALVSCTGYTATNSFTGCTYNGNDVPIDNQTLSSNSFATLDSPLIGGLIKIEKQNAAGVWSDVTQEILNLGFSGASQEGQACADPTPNAVIRLQRLRDNGGGVCDYAGSVNPYDHWPNILYDTREGNYRDVATSGSGSGMNVGGVMSYIALDMANLKRWFAGTIGTTGNLAVNQNGYIIYFSDRRGDHNEAVADAETGEYGFEDVVNPGTSAGTPDGLLQTGENVNGPANTVIDLWGQSPSTVGSNIPASTSALYQGTVRPWTQFAGTAGNPGMVRVNKPILFRRALKLINGGIVSGVNNLPTSGVTVAAENPVYVQGNFNATDSNPSAEPNVPAAVLADAVTLLSRGWTDVKSIRWPNYPAAPDCTGNCVSLPAASGRDALTTSYRMAVVAGKSNSFPWPSPGTPHFLFGTDGGVGNFLRLLENWNISGVSVNYRGSLVSLFISRQATGTFKYGPNVYDFGDRNFTFDDDFLMPALLPPGTPMFRDVNTLTFRQILRPTQ